MTSITPGSGVTLILSVRRSCGGSYPSKITAIFSSRATTSIDATKSKYASVDLIGGKNKESLPSLTSQLIAVLTNSLIVFFLVFLFPIFSTLFLTISIESSRAGKQANRSCSKLSSSSICGLIISELSGNLNPKGELPALKKRCFLLNSHFEVIHFVRP